MLWRGATYRWTGPNSFSSTTMTPSITNVVVADSGTYTVQDSTPGCLSAPVTTHVIINPSPAAPIPVGSNSPICAGATLNLTATSVNGATYHWTGPNGFSSASLTPSITNTVAADSGTYSIVDTVAGCASAPATVRVIIRAPAAPTVSSNSPVCAGSTLQLTATDTGTVTYHWSGPNGFTSSNGHDSITNATLAGTGTYSVTATVDGCPTTGSTSVTVAPGPTAPTLGSNSPVCQGDSLTLTASAITGGTYNWSGPAGFSSGAQNPSRLNVVLADSGTYSVTVTLTGCTPVSASIPVAINPGAPVITAGNNGPVCANQTLQLNATQVNGVTYSWTGPNGYSANIYNPNVPNFTAADSGWYYVTVATPGCGSSTDSTHVSLTASPASPNLGANTPICVGNTLNLTSSTVPGATYHWSGPNGFSSNSQNPSINNVVLADSGTYAITATVAGCGASNSNIHITVNLSLPGFLITANTPICAGDTLNLSVPTYDTYHWTGPHNYVAVDSSNSIPNVDSSRAGKYYVTVTSRGYSGTDSVNVVVNNNPIVKVPSNYYCFGDSEILDSGPFTNYLWSTGATTRTITITALDTIIHTSIYATDSNGCSASENITSTFLAKPDTITFFQSGDTLITSWNSAAAYQWFLNGDSINGTSDTLIAHGDGNYSR